MAPRRPTPPADALVTGASGFLGAHVVEALLRRPAGRVYAVSRRAARFASPRVVTVAADVGREADLDALPARVGLVVHCASPPGPSTDVRALRAANVEGTRNLAAYAAGAGARRLVYVSSGGVCRRGARTIVESAPLAPDTPYLEAKAAGEEVLRAFDGRVRTAIVRLFFPYGPGQREGLVPRLCERLLAGAAIDVGRGGSPRLNPIHVREAARLILRVADAPEDALVVNVAGCETLSLLHLARTLAGLLDVRPVIARTDVRRPSLAGDLGVLRRFGRPRRGLSAGLAAFTKSWRRP